MMVGLTSRFSPDSVPGSPPLPRMLRVSPSLCPRSPYRQRYAKLAVNPLSSITSGALHRLLQTSHPKPPFALVRGINNGDTFQMVYIIEIMFRKGGS